MGEANDPRCLWREADDVRAGVEGDAALEELGVVMILGDGRGSVMVSTGVCVMSKMRGV